MAGKILRDDNCWKYASQSRRYRRSRVIRSHARCGSPITDPSCPPNTRKTGFFDGAAISRAVSSPRKRFVKVVRSDSGPSNDLVYMYFKVRFCFDAEESNIPLRVSSVSYELSSVGIRSSSFEAKFTKLCCDAAVSKKSCGQVITISASASVSCSLGSIA